MGDSVEDLILVELKKISRLLVLNLDNNRSQNEMILLMTKAGFQPKEIADLLGTTSNTVMVARSKAKSKLKKQGGNDDQQGSSEETP
jgi:DNA-directed RNA polymerase specialized sigma24 family protein